MNKAYFLIFSKKNLIEKFWQWGSQKSFFFTRVYEKAVQKGVIRKF
jgi:hypothetical protein